MCIRWPLQIVGTLGVRSNSSSWFISQFHASPPGLLGIRFQHELPAGFVCLSLLVVGLEAQVLANRSQYRGNLLNVVANRRELQHEKARIHRRAGGACAIGSVPEQRPDSNLASPAIDCASRPFHRPDFAEIALRQRTPPVGRYGRVGPVVAADGTRHFCRTRAGRDENQTLPARKSPSRSWLDFTRWSLGFDWLVGHRGFEGALQDRVAHELMEGTAAMLTTAGLPPSFKKPGCCME
jgi:hypothetical protein